MEKEEGLDWNAIGMLLMIVDKAKDHPKLAEITQAALAVLDGHAVNAQKVNAAARQKKAEEEAAAQAKAAADTKAKVDAEAKEATRPVSSAFARRPVEDSPNV